MSGIISDLLDGINKLFDIFNAGRLVFYPAAGALASYPLFMIANLPRLSEESVSYIDSLFVNAIEASSSGSLLTDLLPFLLVSTITGFLIASIAYVLVISPLAQDIVRFDRQTYLKVNKESLAYNYPRLRKEERVDYYSWLVSEFYRYVEIGVYIPVGFTVGLVVLSVYTAIYPLYVSSARSPSELFTAASFFTILVVSILAIVIFIWPIFYKPHVVKVILGKYIGAKISLLEGLNDYEKETKVEDDNQTS